jgi:hypothetical protein
MKVNTNTIPVEASLTTLKGIVQILDSLDNANVTFKNAGFDSPYKLSADDKTLMAMGQILVGGYNNSYDSLDNKSHKESLRSLESWECNSRGTHGIDKVFISFVDTKQSGMKFVFTPSKFGVVITRGYLLDLVGRSNNLSAEAKKATSNRNDWRRNLRPKDNWTTPRLLDMANAIGELDMSVAETFLTRIDCLLLKSKARTRYSYYSSSAEEMDNAECNPYLSQRFERENFSGILRSVYGEHFNENALANIKNGTYNYRSKGLPLAVIQSELVYAINYNRNLKEVTK